MSLGEALVNPSTMLYRNFLAMETEKLLRSLPVDGAVLLGGCDKTTPGMLMGAISMGTPDSSARRPDVEREIARHRGRCQHPYRKYWDEKQAGNITDADWIELESRMTRSIGTCNTMDTASTMTSIVDAMRLTLPGILDPHCRFCVCPRGFRLMLDDLDVIAAGAGLSQPASSSGRYLMEDSRAVSRRCCASSAGCCIATA